MKAALTFDDFTIFYEKWIDKKLPPILGEVLESSDLKAGVYEGGFKIWECSLDLCRYLVNEQNQMNGKRVLELGCGAGLPGIVALKQGARHVSFQDFNEEVINDWTKVNVNLNQDNSDNGNKFLCSFHSGDWSEFENNIKQESQRYDVILASETIYNPDHYEKFHSIMDAALVEDGIGLIAAKAFYFGVGGSVYGFIEFVRSRNMFNIDIVWTSSDTAILRHILLLRRR